MLVGRMATRAATEALHGNTVHIVNCQDAAFSGRKKMIIDDWKRQQDRGVPKKGPFIYRQPDRFVRRIIKGMLPQNARGREALARIRCHVGRPSLEGEELKIENAGVGKLPTTRYVTVGRICRELGGTWRDSE